MKRLFKAFLFLAGLSVAGTATFWIPSTETLGGPGAAILESAPSGAKLGVTAQWWDVLLSRERFGERLVFDKKGRASLPLCKIPTTVGRRLEKHVLGAFGIESPCKYCYGPMTYCSLYQVENYVPPKGTRLSQQQTERDGSVVFAVSLMPDEAQFEPRPFQPADLPALLNECRLIISKGKSPSIDAAAFGAEVGRLNPVRAECSRGAVILWMGGPTGYAVVPDGDGCPSFDRLMMSGTKMKHIYRLDHL